jgi:hypothetical protein
MRKKKERKKRETIISAPFLIMGQLAQARYIKCIRITAEP